MTRRSSNFPTAVIYSASTRPTISGGGSVKDVGIRKTSETESTVTSDANNEKPSDDSETGTETEKDNSGSPESSDSEENDSDSESSNDGDQ